MLSYLSCYFSSSDAVGNSNPTDNVEITTAHVGEAKKNLCSVETTWVLVNRDAVSISCAIRGARCQLLSEHRC